MAHNAPDIHARDELGISETTRARPLQAVLASTLVFSAGAIPPIEFVELPIWDTVQTLVFPDDISFAWDIPKISTNAQESHYGASKKRN